MNTPVLFLIAVLGMACLHTSCKKTEGEGGAASISGKVYHLVYTKNNDLIRKEEARDKDVFIVYGNSEIYNNDMKTHSDGTYRFSYLRKGTYDIFAYEDCLLCDSRKKPVEIEVTVSGKKEEVGAPDILIRKYMDYDEGNSIISGKVYLKDYNNLGQLVDEYYVAEERVYIICGYDSVYFEDMRTGPDGSYSFRNLIPGKYKVFAYSKCDTCSAPVEPIYQQGEIITDGTAVLLPDIVIKN